MNFRSEIFELCKVIQKKAETKEIKKLIHDLCVFVEKDSSSGVDMDTFSNRSDFGYISKHSSNQFYGFLYANEHIESYRELYPRIKRLEESEKKIIEQGHATVMALVDGCLQDVKKNYPVLYESINPYSKYKSIKTISEKSILCEDEIQNAINAFKNSKIYMKLFSSQIVEVFSDMTQDHREMLLGVMDRDIIRTPLDVVPEDIREFSIRILHKIKDVTDVIMAEAVLVLALRESLSAACQLLFVALVGEDLIVLDNNNIINIEKKHSNTLYNIMTVLVDDILLRYSTELPGDILLIDCDPSDNYHIHEFGIIRSSTISFNNETGQTTKVSFVTLDDDMNLLHNLTDAIVKAEFPPVVKVGSIQQEQKRVSDTNSNKKIYPNDPCPCGSGKKYKKCCQGKEICF
jgi:hypothetical protein